jgi:methylated-DNA-protein-cysteine methyltransferase-like protein
MSNKYVFESIRNLVKSIPKSKVSTYGDIAAILGIRSPRVVGWALHGNQNPLIPCHRVVKKDGTLAKEFSLGGWREQRRRLILDGVEFIKENQVDMKKCHHLF